MDQRRRSQLIIKYIFDFDIGPEQWQDPSPDNFWRTLFSRNPIDFQELDDIDILPEKWEFDFWPHRRKPSFRKWHQIKAVDAGEEGGPSEEKYTYYIAFDKKYKDEVMEFLKFADHYNEHVFYEE
jgi:hypothetical protein